MSAWTIYSTPSGQAARIARSWWSAPGPTGLLLAADLLARGVSTRIIDKGDGVNLETRAIAVHARALEVLDLMGLAERFVEHGQIVRWWRFYADGKPRLSLDLSGNGSRFGFMLDIPQHQTECLLRARVAELGGVIEQGTELTGLADEAAGVTARVRDARGQTRVITAGYVAGCDGAHSRVRHELDLPFHGHPYPQDWLLADVRLDWARSEDEVHAFFRADGVPLICFPMREHRWRLVVPFAGDRAPGAPDLTRSSGWSTSGHRNGSSSPTPPGWRASTATADPPAPTGAGTCCWPAMRCTSTPRREARA